MPAAVLAMAVAVIVTVLDAMALVVAGSDGVLLRRIGGQRFFAFRDIAGVTEIGGIKLRLTPAAATWWWTGAGVAARLGRFGLELHLDETRVLQLGRYVSQSRERDGRARSRLGEGVSVVHRVHLRDLGRGRR